MNTIIIIEILIACLGVPALDLIFKIFKIL